MVDRAYFVKSTPRRAFIGSFQHITGILKMCKKKFGAEKSIFDKMTGFNFMFFFYEDCI